MQAHRYASSGSTRSACSSPSARVEDPNRAIADVAIGRRGRSSTGRGLEHRDDPSRAARAKDDVPASLQHARWNARSSRAFDRQPLTRPTVADRSRETSAKGACSRGGAPRCPRAPERRDDIRLRERPTRPSATSSATRPRRRADVRRPYARVARYSTVLVSPLPPQQRRPPFGGLPGSTLS